MAGESRSLAENKLRAVRRLRIKLAAEVREPVDLLHFEPPDWFLTVRHDKHIDASHRHALYSAVGGLMLDLLHATLGNPTAVAINLGVSTSTVIKRLEAEPEFWLAANRIRANLAMPSLTRRV